ncbi:MAG: hypothetical protein A2Y81_09860 [Nitrospirae bacterium RBG_13_43_8]|nr:MAG: hypothetical protein A2Y81_09860 [Nitrospirae bacterium RBG_13_43_8]
MKLKKASGLTIKFWFIRNKIEKNISNNRVSFRLVRNLSLMFCPQMPVSRRIPDALRLLE